MRARKANGQLFDIEQSDLIMVATAILTAKLQTNRPDATFESMASEAINQAVTLLDKIDDLEERDQGLSQVARANRSNT